MPNTRRKITARNLGQKVCDKARFASRSRAAIFLLPPASCYYLCFILIHFIIFLSLERLRNKDTLVYHTFNFQLPSYYLKISVYLARLSSSPKLQGFFIEWKAPITWNYTPKFSEISNREFPFQLTFVAEFFLIFSVKWFALRKFNNFRLSENLPRKFRYHSWPQSVWGKPRLYFIFIFLVLVVNFLRRKSKYCKIPCKRIQPCALSQSYFLFDLLRFEIIGSMESSERLNLKAV